MYAKSTSLIESVRKAAEEALVMWKEKSSKNIWWAEHIENLIKEKQNAYLKWLNTKQSEDRDVYKEIMGTTRLTATAAER